MTASKGVAWAILLAVCVVLMGCTSDTSSQATDSLCPKCRNMAFTADVGVCDECGGTTSSGAFNLCKTCAVKKGVCQACGAKID
jgi:hypothetical protein